MAQNALVAARIWGIRENKQTLKYKIPSLSPSCSQNQFDPFRFSFFFSHTRSNIHSPKVSSIHPDAHTRARAHTHACAMRIQCTHAFKSIALKISSIHPDTLSHLLSCIHMRFLFTFSLTRLLTLIILTVVIV